MTKREMMEKVIAGEISAEVIEMAKAEIVKMDEKNAKRREGISKKAKENAPIKEAILKAAEVTRGIVTVEEHSIYGGLGSIVAETLAKHGCDIRMANVGLRGFVQGYGSHKEVKEANGIGVGDISLACRELLG